MDGSEREGWSWKAWEELGRIDATLSRGGSPMKRLRAAALKICLLQEDMVPEHQRAVLTKIKDRTRSARSKAEADDIIGQLRSLYRECSMVWGS